MVRYRCPKCGRTVELPAGQYFCRVCGPGVFLVPLGAPEGASEGEGAVRSIRNRIWTIYHAVEERDWERLLRDSLFDHPLFREDVRRAEPYFHGRDGMPLSAYIQILRRHVERGDATEAFRIMVEILLCLEPAVPWIH